MAVTLPLMKPPRWDGRIGAVRTRCGVALLTAASRLRAAADLAVLTTFCAGVLRVFACVAAEAGGVLSVTACVELVGDTDVASGADPVRDEAAGVLIVTWPPKPLPWWQHEHG
jgi:hypothetical protein